MKKLIKRAGRHLLGRMGMAPGAGPAGIWSGYAFDAAQLAMHVDCSLSDMAEPQQYPERVHPEISKRVCNWYLPVFGSAFYGGIMTILRLAAHLREKHGIRQRFMICGPCDRNHVANQIATAFPSLAPVDVIPLDSLSALANIPASDYSVASLWTTAYLLLKVHNTGLKFYMIQDYEPLFYPAGSTSAQAELTYRFGFLGIANTESLRDIYTLEYGGRAVLLSPCVDTHIFHPGPPLSAQGPKRVFFYARPGTPRNGFELASVALRRLKDKYLDGVDIVCAGADWNPADFGMQGTVRNVGMLPYESTGELYRSCHAGLAIMMTRHPSYLPFELMASGCLVVANHNSANKWLLKDGENCLLSPPTATCLVETLSRALDGYAEHALLRENAIALINEMYGDWDSALARVACFMVGH